MSYVSNGKCAVGVLIIKVCMETAEKVWRLLSFTVKSFTNLEKKEAFCLIFGYYAMCLDNITIIILTKGSDYRRTCVCVK